jgi:hypothetical protein
MRNTGEGNLTREEVLELVSPFETPPRLSFFLLNFYPFAVQQHSDFKNTFSGVAHLSKTPWTLLFGCVRAGMAACLVERDTNPAEVRQTSIYNHVPQSRYNWVFVAIRWDVRPETLWGDC